MTPRTAQAALCHCSLDLTMHSARERRAQTGREAPPSRGRVPEGCDAPREPGAHKRGNDGATMNRRQAEPSGGNEGAAGQARRGLSGLDGAAGLLAGDEC